MDSPLLPSWLIKGHTSSIFILPIIFSVALGVLYILKARLRTAPAIQNEKAPARPHASKAPARIPGHWQPSSYRRPKPVPYPDWSLTETKPLPYRAFRYGPKYNVTMGLRTLTMDDWIQLDNLYPKYHADKARRIRERGSRSARSAPEAYPAAVELLEELADYLPARYPSLFRRTEVGIDNLYSGESFNIVQRPLPEDPIMTCGRLVQDDVILMIEGTDGIYRLLSAAALLPGFWRLDDKFGMTLSELHTSGDVPQYKEKLERGMMHFFTRLKCEDIYSRNNYFIQVDDDLAWSWSIGNEDDSGAKLGWGRAEKDRAIEHHHFRSERQTLRRLPKTGAVVFTVRTYLHPITEIAKEDYVPGRLASAVRSWGDDVSRYKGKERYGDVLLEYLDKEHEKQVARGLKPEQEETMYPW